MKSSVSTASFSACWLGIRRMPARGVAGERGPLPKSLKCFLCPVPTNGGGGRVALDLRLLPTWISGAGARPSPCWEPVTDMRFTAASIVGFVSGRQYTARLSVTATTVPELGGLTRAQRLRRGRQEHLIRVVRYATGSPLAVECGGRVESEAVTPAWSGIGRPAL
jgi:hypothetical protein